MLFNKRINRYIIAGLAIGVELKTFYLLVHVDNCDYLMTLSTEIVIYQLLTFVDLDFVLLSFLQDSTVLSVLLLLFYVAIGLTVCLPAVSLSQPSQLTLVLVVQQV